MWLEKLRDLALNNASKIIRTVKANAANVIAGATILVIINTINAKLVCIAKRVIKLVFGIIVDPGALAMDAGPLAIECIEGINLLEG